MATRKPSTKPKLTSVPNIIVPVGLQLNSEVYTIQGLADGARGLIQRYYESHDDDPDAGILLRAMRILDVADERLDRLAERVAELESREATRE